MREGRLFINYRRDDSRADSGRLYDRLAACFPGKVFRDVASIAPGVEWHDAIARVLSQSDACLVIIGKNWLKVTDDAGNRRLDDPRDTVRQEIAAVLKRNMRVFPVLVGGATMPAQENLPADLQPLCGRNAIELTEAYWDEGVQKLILALEPLLGRPHLETAKPPLFRRWWVLVASGALAALIALAYVGTRHPDDPGPLPQPVVPPSRDYSTPNPPHQTYAAFNPSQLVGNWRGVVTGPGSQLDEEFEVYPDSSFRVLLPNNTTNGVGTWQYDPAADSLKVTHFTNLINGVKLVCNWKNASEAHDRFSGACIDSMQQQSWNVSLTRLPGRPAMQSYIVPRVNLASLTTAERAAFSQYLASQRCTCQCGMSVLMCLRKDPNCRYSPNLAQNALTAFLQRTRA
jgi:hypothetical protein